MNVPIPGTDVSGKQPYASGLLARITAIHFPAAIGDAVEFAPKASLIHPSLPMEDTGQFTFSGWIRFPAFLSAFQYIFELDTADETSHSFMLLSGGGVLQVSFSTPIIYDPVLGVSTRATIVLRTPPSISISFDQWHHIFTSINWDYGSTADLGPRKRLFPFHLFVDGRDVGDYYTGVGETTGYKFSDTPGFNDPNYPPSGTTGIKINGSAFGTPIETTVAPSYGAALLHECCDTQIWIGTFIDAYESISNFYQPVHTASGIVGGRVPLSFPAARFGRPTFVLTGGAKSYVVNKGIGPALTTQGSITDYSPAPPTSIHAPP